MKKIYIRNENKEVKKEKLNKQDIVMIRNNFPMYMALKLECLDKTSSTYVKKYL